MQIPKGTFLCPISLKRTRNTELYKVKVTLRRKNEYEHRNIFFILEMESLHAIVKYELLTRNKMKCHIVRSVWCIKFRYDFGRIARTQTPRGKARD